MVECLCIEFSNPRIACVLNAILLEVVCVIEFTNKVFSDDFKFIELAIAELISIFVYFASTGLVDLGCGLLACNFDVLFDSSVAESVNVENKLHEIS